MKITRSHESSFDAPSRVVGFVAESIEERRFVQKLWDLLAEGSTMYTSYVSEPRIRLVYDVLLANQPLRDALYDGHPLLGAEYRKLRADDVLLPSDETALMSLLQSGAGEWTVLGANEEWRDSIGQPMVKVRDIEMDAQERVFRRRK